MSPLPPPRITYMRQRPDGSFESAPSDRGTGRSIADKHAEEGARSPLPPGVTHIRSLPDGSFEGAPSNQGPWRPIPNPCPPRRLVALPPLPGQGGTPQGARRAALWRRVFESMAAADDRAWEHLDAIDEQQDRDAAVAAGLAHADRFAAEAMLVTIRRAVVNHLHSRGISTAAQIVGSWFDQQITHARKGE
jgi:hypothetical protein